MGEQERVAKHSEVTNTTLRDEFRFHCMDTDNEMPLQDMKQRVYIHVHAHACIKRTHKSFQLPCEEGVAGGQQALQWLS